MILNLINNRLEDKTLTNLLTHMQSRARAVYIPVAYLRVSSVVLEKDAVMGFIRRGGWLRILAGAILPKLNQV